MDRVYIFDTTLRDGEQSPGISLNKREKLEIAEQLERLGVDFIEAGFPITSVGDFEAVQAIARKITNATVVGLARALDQDIDRAWEALKDAESPCIHTFLATSDIHMRKKLNKTREEVLEMTAHAVKRAKSYCSTVEFSPEDASRADFDFLCQVVMTAIENGATTINIPDTVGYAVPDEFGGLIKSLLEVVPELADVIVSVHCHNDLGLAVANSLAAVVNGANQIECAVNGLGERAGNAALEEIVMILDTRARSLNKSTNIKTEEIIKTSRLVSNLTGYQIQFNKAIVGANAFAHSSGIHTDGMLKDRTTYEVMVPQKVGLTESAIILGKTSGRHALKSHLEQMGYSLSDDELNRIFASFKDLADKKAEVSDDDLEAIVAGVVRKFEDIFVMRYIKTSSGTDETPHAQVVLVKSGEEIKADATGDGQVDAVCLAISKATGVKGSLMYYNVSSITGGLDAQGDVSVKLSIDGKEVLGRGVSTDIIEASAEAYLNAINRFLAE